MGIAIGLALNNYLPVCCYPRFDFAILALNQLVNHLDKINVISSNNFNPFVIVRILIGSNYPINSGEQHTQNYIERLRLMLKYISVVELKSKKEICEKYFKCLKEKKSTVFIEHSKNY